jgi:hypothetical protein
VNDGERVRTVTGAAQRLAWLAQALTEAGPDGDTVLGRLRATQGPLRGRCYEAPASSGRADGTPAGAFRPDAAQRDQRDLDAALVAIASAVARCWAIARAYPPPHVADAAERRALGLGEGPCCASCARTAGADGSPR